jgi:DNA modification methylase
MNARAPHQFAEPCLTWPGKRDPLEARPSAPVLLRTIETHGEGPSDSAGWRNKLVLGDNLRAGSSLLETLRGRVDLLYLDPPFATGSAFSYQPLREDGSSSSSEVAYSDAWSGGLSGYLQFLHERLAVARDLLKDTGSLYVHLDATVVHYAKALLDELLGRESFQREIVWRIGWVSGYKSAASNWIRNHDTILFYVKTPGRFTFNKEYLPYPPGYQRRAGARGGRGYPLDDVWNANSFESALKGRESLNSIQIVSFSREKTGYPTQKNESLLRRIVRASSNPGDLVADLFCGSGTTLAAAEDLGRRWVGCDVGQLAVHHARRRLLARDDRQPFEVLEEQGPARPPAQLAVEPRLRRSGPDLEVVLEGPLDDLDAWAVDFDCPDEVLRPQAFAARQASRRKKDPGQPPAASLAHTCPDAGPRRVRIHLWDLQGRRVAHTLEG